MGAIYWLGTDRASASHTHSWLHTFLQQFFRASVGAGVLDALNVGIRKSGHFLGYALLGLLNCRALRAAGLPPRRAALLGWTAAAAWAAVDEYHQSFSPSRGATVEDVFLDSCGAATGIFLYSLWIRTRKPSA